MERKSFNDGGQFAWDGTSLELASDCLRKYYYQMIANIRPASSSVHLLFGGIYATALERYFKDRAEGMDYTEALRECVRRALVLSWDAEAGLPLAFEDAAKTRIGLIRTLVWYLDQFEREGSPALTTVHLASGEPAVELSFTVEFNDEFLYCGHLDRVVEYGGGLYWMDQKTTKSALGPHFAESYKITNQFFGYTWAGQTLLKSPVKGGILDAAQIGVNFSRFERFFISFTEPRLDEWHAAALYHIRSARQAHRTGYYPQNFSACGKYGGCPYRELCSRNPSIRENFIKGSYVHPEQPWDPLVPR